ncbi:MAG TPA: DUF4239 domain-containing protein [Candidatus Baltobacteraceae bacterium]
MVWIYGLPSWVFGPLAVAALCVLAAAGLFYARRHVLRNDEITHNDVAGPILGTIGTLLAVMLSFMVVAVWQEYDASANTVEREASAASDLHHLADLLAQPTRNRLKAEVDRYMTVVIHDDFPAMQRGQSSSRARDASYRIYQIVAGFKPASPGQTQLQGEALDLAHVLTDARRQRLHDNRTGIPMILWATMFFLGALTVVFSYFFRIENVTAHFLMTLALTAVIGVMLVLIAELDYPFRGDTAIGPQAIVEAYARTHDRDVTSRY